MPHFKVSDTLSNIRSITDKLDDEFFEFEWTGQVAEFSIRGSFSYDEDDIGADGIVNTDELSSLNVEFFNPDGELLKKYTDNHLDEGVNFNFDPATGQILQDGVFNSTEGINIGDGARSDGLTFWSKPFEQAVPHVHVDDWQDEFGFPRGFSSHEDVAFFDFTTQDLLDSGAVGDAYVNEIENDPDRLDDRGQRIDASPVNPLSKLFNLDFGTIDEDVIEVEGSGKFVFTGGGNDFVDTAAAGEGHNRVFLGRGDDIGIVGQDDRFTGGRGDDEFLVLGGDNLVFAGAGDDIVDASASIEGGNRFYLGAGDDIGILGQGDRFIGGRGDDQFFAVEGGDNVITGGRGADQFWITTGDFITNILELEVSEAYYTFFGNVSSNSEFRLLSDKATAIGFPGLDTNSFLHFDDIPSEEIASGLISATLQMEHDAALAELANLIPATEDRPVNVSAYALEAEAEFDPINGNDADIDFGVDGANALSTTSVGANGIYAWDVTALVQEGLGSGEVDVAISGVFGNTNTDDRNSYAAFYPDDATDGLEPTLVIEAKGINTIKDFKHGQDVIGIAGFDVGFDDIELTKKGKDTLVGIDGVDLALLEDVKVGDLSASDFLFV